MSRLALLALLTACGEDPPASSVPTADTQARPSVLLVTLDTTRADHLGAYGRTAASTPTLDGLAAGGVRFERAYATVPLTTPAHASMMTGLYPTRHGVHNNGDAILADVHDTVAERLSASGYRTAASVSAFVTTRVWNLDQGFDAYFDDLPSGAGGGGRWGQERAAELVVNDLVGWLGAPSEEPFFAWAHFYDPHHPHEAPEPFLSAHENVYDAEIAYMDSELGRLLAAAETAAGPGGLHVVVLADHGEAFDGEHDEQTHGLFLFDPTMRIPFIVRPAGGLEVPVVSDVTVSGVDVAPTVLGLLGLDGTAGMDGQDLSPTVRGGAAPVRPVYMESTMAADRFGYAVERAAAEGSLKLMDTPDARLYDVDADPGETRNLLGDRPDDVTRLRDAVAAVVAASSEAGAGDGPSQDVVQQLAELGYLSTDFAPSAESAGIDAKTRAGTLKELEDLRSGLSKGEDPKAVVAAYRALVEREPQLAEARMGLGRALARVGDDAGAEAVYKEALELQPTSALLRVNLANAIAAQGRLEEGLALVESVLVQVPDDSLARSGVLRMLTDLGRLEEAEKRARGWLEADAGDPGVSAQLGVILLRKGDLDGAEPMLRASLADGVPRQLVHKGLGFIEKRRRHPKRARKHYELELQAFPNNRELNIEIGSLSMDLKEWEPALAAWDAALARFPKHPLAVRGKAQALFNLGRHAEAAAVLEPWTTAHPKDPDALMLYANVLASLGRKDEGAAAAERAKALHQARMEKRSEVRARKGGAGGAPPAE